MYSKKNSKRMSRQICMTFSVLLMVVLTAPTLWAAEKQTNKNTTVAGSGDKYKTTVTRQSKGQISPEDLRQVSLLASQVLLHVNKAEQSIELGNSDSAKAEIKDTENLIDIAHKLLPVKLVTTTVKDAKGTEVYKNTETTQDDVIRLYQVDTLVGKIKEKGAIGKIHALWHKTTGLFEKHPSQAKPTVQKTTTGNT